MLRQLIATTFNKLGYSIVKNNRESIIFMNGFGVEDEFKDIYQKSKDYTMTSVQKMYALYLATKYVIKNEIPGDFVECGTWKGGSSMNMALTLKVMGQTDRKIYLYDTYEGMSEPSEKDVGLANELPIDIWRKARAENVSKWCCASLEEVKDRLYSTGYPKGNLIFIKGKVEETIPTNMPDRIALLRLDTDWYKSTSHELKHLFPLLSTNGVLILDDYDSWKGVKQATDSYFEENDVEILLNKIDYAGRIGLKT